MTNASSGSCTRQRGVSLIEALVAFAVMAFGMLAVVAMQGTLRSNGDLARQRAEALRIAQDYMEEVRGFSVFDQTVNRMAYVDIPLLPPVVNNIVAGPKGNTKYTMTRQVIPHAAVANTVAPQGLTVAVIVAWKDRTDTDQSVRLSSYIAGVAPELAASIMTATNKLDRVTVSGRSPYIPQDAALLPGGGSVWVPPGQAPNPNGNVAWKFNNADASITLCLVPQAIVTTAQLVAQNFAGLDCVTLTALGLKAVFFGGYIGYAGALAPPNPNVYFAMTNPPPNILANVFFPGCFHEALNVAAPARFVCAVPTTVASNNQWSGSLVFDPDPAALLPPFPGTLAAAALTAPPYFIVCRYVDNSVPPQPPADMLNIGSPLDNQNFIVQTDAIPCPVGTVQHQPR